MEVKELLAKYTNKNGLNLMAMFAKISEEDRYSFVKTMLFYLSENLDTIQNDELKIAVSTVCYELVSRMAMDDMQEAS
jgi:hypothetical protein